MTTPGLGFWPITRPTRLERARRTRPTEQFALRILVFAAPSLSPITLGPDAPGRGAEVAAEAVEVAVAVVAVEVAAVEVAEVAAVVAEVAAVVAEVAEAVVEAVGWRRWRWRRPTGSSGT